MAFLSSLLKVTQPKGFWITIVKAFEGATKNYILAIILLTVVIRLVFAIIEFFSKYVSQKMAKMQEQLKPEEDRIRNRYEKKIQQAQNKGNVELSSQLNRDMNGEINQLRQKRFGKTQYAGCLLSLVTMVLNFTILLGLWGGLNNMSAYKIYENYDNIKYTYVNCLNVVDDYLTNASGSQEDKYAIMKDYQHLNFVIKTVEGKKTVSLVYKGGEGEEILATTDYLTEKDLITTQTLPPEEDGGEETTKEIPANQAIITLIQKYFKTEGDEEFAEVVIGQVGEGEEAQDVYLSTAIRSAINKQVVKVYDATQEKFLWIQNIWIPESPAYKSIVSFDKLKSQIGKNNFEEGEKTIYNAFMPSLKKARSVTNGYYIIAIMCVVMSLLSVFTSNLYNKWRVKKQSQASGQALTVDKTAAKMKYFQIIIPVVFGLLALFYNSVFAIYMLTGQIVSFLLNIPQLMIIDAILGKKEFKEKENNTVEYSRKF